MIRGLLGVIAGIAVWALLWTGLNKLLPFFFSRQFGPDGTSDNFIINLIIVLVSFDFSFFSGYINAIIAKVQEFRYAFVQAVIQLAIGIYVQRQYWDLQPLWFHLSFLAFIGPAIFAGATYRMASQQSRTEE